MATKSKINYADGKVYKIVGPEDLDDGLRYVGSTTKKYLSQRFCKHVADYKQWKISITKKRYFASFDVFEMYGVDNCKIILLETCNVVNKDELRAKEQYHIKSQKCVNKHNALTTPEELKEKGRQNSIKFHALNPNYKTENKDRFRQARDKYQLNNPEKVKAHDKAKYERKKDLKIRCEACNCDIKLMSKARHYKTAKHISNLKNVI